jgi:hypothetical protein
MFPVTLATLHPPSPQPTVEQALEGLLATLKSGSPASLIRFMRRVGDPEILRKAYARAAQLWWTLREPSTVSSAFPLAMHEDGPIAAEACQFFSARNPDRLDLRILYFEKSDDGWYWTPSPVAATEKSMRAWADRQTQRWQDDWQDALLSECPILEKIPDAGAPAEDESRKLIESWIQAMSDGDVMAALRLTARLHSPDSQAGLLRNLGYEMIGARRNPHAPTLAGILRGGIWTAVGTQTAPNDPPSFPIYPVIATPAGPRILLEIDLFASGNRSRDFLNKTAIERLRKSSAPAADDLELLFARHQAQLAAPPKP